MKLYTIYTLCLISFAENIFESVFIFTFYTFWLYFSPFHPITFNFWVFLINFKEKILFTLHNIIHYVLWHIIIYIHHFSPWFHLCPTTKKISLKFTAFFFFFFYNPWSLVSTAHTCVVWCHPWEHRKPRGSTFPTHFSGSCLLSITLQQGMEHGQHVLHLC